MAEKEYIEREALQNKAFGKNHPTFYDGQDIADWYEKCINETPVADVSPVRHGRWIINSDGYYPQCSECMSEPRGREMTKYCGECGAKMDGDKYARKIHQSS